MPTDINSDYITFTLNHLTEDKIVTAVLITSITIKLYRRKTS